MLEDSDVVAKRGRMSKMLEDSDLVVTQWRILRC